MVRCLFDGVAKAIRCRVAFVTQSGNIASPSYWLRIAKPSRWCRLSHDRSTMLSRFNTMASRGRCEGQAVRTNSTRHWTFVCPSDILACQRCRRLKTSPDRHTMGKDALTNNLMCSQSMPKIPQSCVYRVSQSALSDACINTTILPIFPFQTVFPPLMPFYKVSSFKEKRPKLTLL